jgi:hypothetical protein
MIWQDFVKTVVCAVTVGVACGCAAERTTEDSAVQEFHQRLQQDRADLIYAGASTFLRDQLSEAQFRHFLSETRSLGALEQTERAQLTRTSVPGGPDLIVAFYNSRYEQATCLESFSWHAEKEGLKLASYSCARNMQVSCPGGVAGSKCETSPVPTPGFAGLP